MSMSQAHKDAITHSQKIDWTAWNEERKRFLEHDSQGWDSDIEALEAHIAQLAEVAPKDNAGWINFHAMEVIDDLQRHLATTKVWRGEMP